MTPPEPTAEARAAAWKLHEAWHHHFYGQYAIEACPACLEVALALDAFRAQGVEQAERKALAWKMAHRKAEQERGKLSQRLGESRAQVEQAEKEREEAVKLNFAAAKIQNAEIDALEAELAWTRERNTALVEHHNVKLKLYRDAAKADKTLIENLANERNEVEQMLQERNSELAQLREEEEFGPRNGRR